MLTLAPYFYADTYATVWRSMNKSAFDIYFFLRAVLLRHVTTELNFVNLSYALTLIVCSHAYDVTAGREMIGESYNSSNRSGGRHDNIIHSRKRLFLLLPGKESDYN